jgi:hypothetical protein
MSKFGEPYDESRCYWKWVFITANSVNAYPVGACTNFCSSPAVMLIFTSLGTHRALSEN